MTKFLTQLLKRGEIYLVQVSEAQCMAGRVWQSKNSDAMAPQRGGEVYMENIGLCSITFLFLDYGR